ncbi:MAG: glycosyltransferase [bacterium]|nr:glycosyltransferase [bacterium]
MKVLMISHAGVIDENRRRLYIMLERYPGLEMALMTPAVWHEKDLKRVYEAGSVRGQDRAVAEGGGLRLIKGDLYNNGNINMHWYRSGLREALDDFEPDILHVEEEPYSLASFQAVRMSSGRKIKIIAFSFQNIFKRYPWPFRAIERYVLERTDYVIAGNAEVMAVLRRKGYSGPARVVPLGVDTSVFRAQRRTDPVPQDGSCTIGYMGRFIPGKGLYVLLKAMTEVSDDIRLRLIGGGPEEAGLRRAVEEMGLSERVRFFDLLPHSEVPGCMRQLDAFILPSLTMPNWKEQFGRVLVEAMACGVVPVGSSSGEIPNVIGPAGLVFREGDHHDLAAKIRQLFSDKALRSELVNRGRRRAEEMFSWESVAAHTYGIYAELSGEGTPDA